MGSSSVSVPEAPPGESEREAWASQSTREEAQVGGAERRGLGRGMAIPGRRGLPAWRATRLRRPCIACAVASSP